MARKIVKCENWPKDLNPYPGSETRTYEIQLITPLFGGGTNAGVNDPVTLIRPSSIRGQLRFWWRATRGANCATTAKLRQREGEIWGTTDNPSPVGIQVKVEENDDPFECASHKWDKNMRHGNGGYRLKWSAPFDTRNSPLPYALFPFQGRAPDGEEPRDPSKMVRSARFKLIIQISSHNCGNIEKDVEAAVWAWVNFGGIGARSRRGCGALYCMMSDPQDLDFTPPSSQNFNEWLKKRISNYGLVLSANRSWPTLGKIYLGHEVGTNSISCWEECISVMKEIRQGVGLGRDSSSGSKPGRSKWPEAESVRNIATSQQGMKTRPSKWHPPDPRMPDIAFPRAEFGMPIIIEIRGEGLKPTLQPYEDHDRMASPLILRPIRFSNSRFAAMIIRLNTPPLSSAYLKPGKKDLSMGRTISASEISDPGRSAFPESPRHKFCAGGCSALDAFVLFARNRGFGEVIP